MYKQKSLDTPRELNLQHLMIVEKDFTEQKCLLYTKRMQSHTVLMSVEGMKQLYKSTKQSSAEKKSHAFMLRQDGLDCDPDGYDFGGDHGNCWVSRLDTLSSKRAIAFTYIRI